MTITFFLPFQRKRLFRNSQKNAKEEEGGELKKRTNNHERGYLLLFMILILMVASFLLFTFRYEIKVQVIRNLGLLRHCSSLSSTSVTSPLRIAIVTIALQQKQRNEDETGENDEGEEIGFSFAEEAIENKRSYAARHGYAFFLENELDPTLLDIEFEATNRLSSTDSSPSLKEEPKKKLVLGRLKPSWLKIKAVEKHLLPSSSSASYFDWVFWMDADALIMNPNIRLEDIIVSSIPSPFSPINSESTTSSSSSSVDLLLTRDHRSINAGVWFLRRSSWSLEFLSAWWSLRLQERFVRKWRSKTPDDTIGRSGDQDALHYLLKLLSKSEPTSLSFLEKTEVGQEGREWEEEHWKEGEGSENVRVVRQCLFNSYFEWRSFDGVFMNGDFVCHFAGLFHHRSELIHSFLKEHNIYAGAQWV